MEEQEGCYKLPAVERNALLNRPDFCHFNGGHAVLEKSPNDLALLLRTLQFATLKHSTQRRKDPEKTPYINHPIGVANILASEGGVTDVAVLQGALLHDTVEDTNTTLDEIENHFGASVRRIVEEVTDNKALSYDERKRHQIARAPFVSYEAKLVKLADKLHNLRDLLRCAPEGWSPERVLTYFEWAKKVVEGLLGTNLDLEEAIRLVMARKGVVLPSDRPSLLRDDSPL
ncbi:Guanosine-3',5'-bis(diphosphate) 3'-pyrophosphohydrolase MESH1 [Hypsibius exemplaris]|uniref:Guanosine-3',5'-bis(diphosphate) 3'-pyrophosphohydrolase MESH1 n=1 Tax=Hypsibius exemplaris TaxID=2072580 RepID=A0A1W0XDK8_HYPEX|nr:Guanosine-3',5'-bis(diphosphate) 3'-pyrophosphohydrolase MESH1 [Hypsibius exemplaris]